MKLENELKVLREYAYNMFMATSDILLCLEKEKKSKKERLDKLCEHLKIIRNENASHINTKDLEEINMAREKKGSVSLKRETRTLKDGSTVTYERYMGRVYHKGKQHCVYGKTKTECWKKLNDLIKEFETNPQLNINNKTCMKDWFMFYFENYKKREVKESSYTILSYNLNKFLTISETFNKIKISNVNEVHCNEVLDMIQTESLYKFAKTLFNDSFKIAVAKGLMKYDISVLLRGSFKAKDENDKVEQELKKEKNIIPYEVQASLLNDAKSKGVYEPIMLSLYTGLRLGEVFGLRWSNIKTNYLEVRQQYNINSQKYSTLKSASSARNIPLTIGATKILATIKHTESDYIFSNPKLMLRKTQRFFQELYPAYTFHSLRHTFASRLFALEINPKVIQSYLGHASLSMTTDTYVHAKSHDALELYKGQCSNDELLKFK